MTTDMPNFANRYRPRRFEDFWGQTHPVRFLSGLIQRGQIGRSLLLHGSVGSGKTSLARLYAKALNCDAPQDGSPCGICRWCTIAATKPKEAGFYEVDVPAAENKADMVRAILRELNRTPPNPPLGYRIRTLFFDEAHSLSKPVAEILLKSVEEPQPRVIFCFATTEFDAIPTALRSRLFHLEVRPLPPDLAIRFLRTFADREGIAYEPEALALLASLKHGYPRDLLIGLEQVYDPDGGMLTVARVREVFDVDHTDVLVDYFLALADGDFARQTKTIFAWREPPIERVRWVRAFLTALYYTELIGLDVTVEPSLSAIASRDRTRIIERFRDRLGLSDRRDLAPIWRELMRFWANAKAVADDSAGLLQVTLFHDLVNSCLTAAGSAEHCDLAGTNAAIPRSPDSQALASTSVATAAIRSGASEDDADAAFLRLQDVRTIIDTASFLMQEHGVTFNAVFRLRPALFAGGDEAALIAAFDAELDAQAASWSIEPFARLSLVERDELGLRGTVLAHLPHSKTGRAGNRVAQAESWHRSWRQPDRIGLDADALSLRVGPIDRIAAVRFHWQEVLDLCAGLDRAATGWDPEATRPRQMLELLSVRRPRQSAPVEGPLIRVSEPLSAAAIARASRNGMMPLSVFANEAWSHLKSGWELDEHVDRLRLRESRELDLAILRQTFGDGSAAAQSEVDARVSLWAAEPPERRPRTWRSWWQGGEA
ncbi:AAA family ATPase [Methylobacterium sp. WL64]|uniref:AAA family ATPase n=1 Tax=Methylobacterium sp. WL64 TaxID=2603894 RepID=UPI0011C7BB5E|nr:AAA family ATPase [Methylobacterium sp. WL64]TXN01978.1 AAA family ATPase [Methylobacterium sp. WL64]